MPAETLIYSPETNPLQLKWLLWNAARATGSFNATTGLLTDQIPLVPREKSGMYTMFAPAVALEGFSGIKFTVKGHGSYRFHVVMRDDPQPVDWNWVINTEPAT